MNNFSDFSLNSLNNLSLLMKDWEAKLLSHLSAEVIKRLLRENRKTIPKCLSVNLFKNASLHIINFIPVS